MPRAVDLYLYKVDITESEASNEPPQESKRVRTCDKLRIFKKFARDELEDDYPFYDGQDIFYSTKHLGQLKSASVTLGEPNDQQRSYSVEIRDVKELQYDPSNADHGTELEQEFVQALDIAIRSILSDGRECARRLLVSKAKNASLGKHFELYEAVLTSVRPGQSKIFVNADKLMTVFYKPGLITDLLGRPRRLGKTDRDFLNSLVGCKVRAVHLPYIRIRTVESVTITTASETKIEITDQSQPTNGQASKTTVAKYFEKYEALKYPNLPCLKVVSTRTCYYPLETCYLEKLQRGSCRLPGNLKKPQERIRLAIDVVQELIKSEKFSACVASISATPVEIKANILPVLKESFVMPKQGEVRWIIVNTFREDQYSVQLIKQLQDGLVDQAAQMGVHLRKNIQTVYRHWPCEDTLARAREEVDLAVIVLESPNSSHYPHLKYFAETKLGLITQCVVLDSRFSRASFQKNVMRKIKAKLGSVDKAMPRKIDNFDFADVLVMGADVSHHGPRDSRPSVAAIVASADDHASRYVAAIRPQEKADGKKRIEIILEMGAMVKSLFDLYKKGHEGKAPKAILFYRDGVSEGEFGKVYEEVSQLKLACESEFCGSTLPKITFVTVQKRHRTRFMCRPEDPIQGKDGNVPPGTVVDTTITRTSDEFFMCSHAPIRGTARPAHYRVIVDDNKLDAGTLQKITLSLCHMYARCDTPVSIPAPVYYAHLAAARASCYMKSLVQHTGSWDVKVEAIQPTDNLKTEMFFI
ncbi:hypothetical protein HPB50_001253 [Hyalomma asiaticum]|uniref:Uncharacterized protein n=1 Tax=Hyalomma asiaticum TaxID=266040 RepID=A0ACB7S292_HYAAI|nr:hypothetical protein HPB50_001253 [Hyalomma asiaticum]